MTQSGRRESLECFPGEMHGMRHRIYESHRAGLLAALVLMSASCKYSSEQGTYFPNRTVPRLDEPSSSDRRREQQGAFAGQESVEGRALSEGDGLVLYFTRSQGQLCAFDSHSSETLAIELPMPESLPAEYEITGETSVFYGVHAQLLRALKHCEGRVRLERADRSLLAVTVDLAMTVSPFEEAYRWTTTAGFWRSNGFELQHVD